MRQTNRDRTEVQPTTHRLARRFPSLVLVAFLVGCASPTPPTPPAPTSAPFLFISPSAALLTTPGEKQEFTVRAFDAQGKEMSIDGLGLEWVSSNPSQIALSPDPSTPGRVTATAVSPLGFAALAVRSRTNPSLVSNPVPTENARLLPGVQTIPDKRVVFPIPNLPPVELPADAPLSDISLPDASGRVTIGGFSDQEVTALYDLSGNPNNLDAPFKALEPLVIRGAPVPAVGTVLVASGGSDVFHRVIRLETRGEFSLLQLEPVNPVDVYQQADTSFDVQQFVEAGVMTPEMRDAMLDQVFSDEEAPETPSALRPAAIKDICEATGSKSIDDLALNVEYDPNNVFKPTLKFTNTLGVDFQNRRVTPGVIRVDAGYALDAKATITPKFAGSGEIGFECKLFPGKGKGSKLRSGAVGPQALPILPVIGALLKKIALHIVKNVRPKLVDQKAVLKGSIKVSGSIEFSNVVTARGSGSMELGFSFDGQKTTPISEWKGSAPTIKVDFDTKDDLRGKTKAKVESSLGISYSTGFALIYKPLDRSADKINKTLDEIEKQLKLYRKLLDNNKWFRGRLPKIIEAFDKLVSQLEAITSFVKALTKGLSIGSASASAEASLVWENAVTVLEAKKSASTAETFAAAKIEFGLDQVNKLLEGLQLPKIPTWTPLDQKFFRSVYYRPLAEDKVLVNGKPAGTTVLARPDTDIDVFISAKYTDVPAKEFIGPDTPADSGLVWLEAKDGLRFVDGVKLDGAGTSTLRGKIRITKAICDSLKDSKQGGEAGTFLIAGFNKLLIAPTPGYVGQFSLRCEPDEVKFTANGVTFPDPSGQNIAIVGTEPDDTCQEARNVQMSANVRDPSATAKFSDLVFKLDGQELARAAGGTSDASVPLGSTVTRNIKPGSRTFTLEYTSDAVPNQRQTRSETFTVKVKKTDETLCDDPGTRVIASGNVKLNAPFLNYWMKSLFTGGAFVRGSIDGKEVCTANLRDQNISSQEWDYACFFTIPGQLQEAKLLKFDLVLRRSGSQIANILEVDVLKSSDPIIRVDRDIIINPTVVNVKAKLVDPQGRIIGSSGREQFTPYFGSTDINEITFQYPGSPAGSTTITNNVYVFPGGKPFKVEMLGGSTDVGTGFKYFGKVTFDLTPTPGATLNQDCGNINLTDTRSPNPPRSVIDAIPGRPC